MLLDHNSYGTMPHQNAKDSLEIEAYYLDEKKGFLKEMKKAGVDETVAIRYQTKFLRILAQERRKQAYEYLYNNLAAQVRQLYQVDPLESYDDIS